MKKIYLLTLIATVLSASKINAQWTSLNAPASNYETYQMLAVSDDGKNLFSYMSDLSGKAYFVCSHDFGSTWQQYLQPTTNFVTHSAPINGETIFWEGDVLYYTNFDGIFKKSTDFGATFSTQSTQIPSYRPILRSPNGKWYQPGSGNWHVSTDKGITWSTLPSGIDAIAYLTAKNGNIIGLISNGGIGYSEDNGVSWKSSTLPAGTIWQYTSVAKATDGTLIAFYYSSPSILLKSTDNGVTWQKVNAVIPASTKVVCYSGNDIIAYSILGTTYKSSDGGLSFTALNSKTIMTIISSMISNGKNIYLHGMSGIYVYGSLTTGVRFLEKEQPSIFPNPCQNILYLESAENYRSYSLNDLTGRMVDCGLINDSKINVSQIHTGIYILSATNSEGKKLSVKIVKE